MALVIGKKQAANGIDSQWREYKDKKGVVLAKVLIRGIDHKPYQIAAEKIGRYGAKLDLLMSNGLTVDALSAEDDSLTENEAHFYAAGRHLIADWSDVVDENGDEVKYTPDVAAVVLEQNVEMYFWLIKCAVEIQRSENEQVDETVKKPSPVTAGSSKTKPRKKPNSSANV